MWTWLGKWFVACGKARAFCEGRYQLARLKSAGRRVSVGRDFSVYGPECITVEDDVILAHQITLRALTAYPWAQPPQTFHPEIILRRGCFLNNRTEISAVGRIEIGANTMFGPGCFVTDHAHGYEDATRSPRHQPIAAGGELVIGEDGWLGANVCVAGPVRLGRHCIVGANSVVTGDLPDFCLAAGAPARVIKRYDPASGQWRAPT